MREAHPAEQEVGIRYYASETDGIGGRLRAEPEHFRVREIEGVEPEPVDADPGAYEHLVVRVRLRGWDTNDFARALANRLGMSRERVSWAGTKDKRAVTTQLFSVRGVDPEDLPALSDAEITPVGRFGRAIWWGDLAGNAFDITVTDPVRPERVALITGELEGFGPGDGWIGVPNYFGPQRFGTIRQSTHKVGLRILRGDWKGAVVAYVGEPVERESAEVREARAFVEETEDWAGGLERMPERLRNERAILHVLAGADGDGAAAYRAALGALPSSLQRLFVHAAQSYLFNQMLSERLRRGVPVTRAVPGDVVCFTDRVGEVVVADTDRCDRVTAENVEVVNRHVSRGRAVVSLPLVGTDTAFESGEPGRIVRGVLEANDLDREAFALPEPYHSTGTRRAGVVQVRVRTDEDPVRFRFALPRGAYATVVLREYLKTPPWTMG